MKSADGKGRTIFEILTGRNKRDMTPLELQYHNPLEAKVSCCVTLEDEPELKDIRFFIEKIAVYRTQIGSDKHFHTDYCLKGTSLSMDKPVRLRLRLVKDEDSTNRIGHKFQLLHLYDDFGYNEDFFNCIIENGSCDPDWDAENEFTFKVNYDDENKELEIPRRYWRVDNAIEPYIARQTTLVDDDGNGKIDDDELEHRETSYWDFSRMTEGDGEGEVEEYLWIEMDNDDRYFNLFRGSEILASQVRVF
jgi:hypothetical protein